MLHSGIVYPSERNPTQLFEALGRLQKARALSPADLHIRFRASVHDDCCKAWPRLTAHRTLSSCALRLYRTVKRSPKCWRSIPCW